VAALSNSSSSPLDALDKTSRRSSLAKLRVAELRSLAADAGVQLGSGTTKKAELIDRLLLAETGGGDASAAAVAAAADACADTSPTPRSPPSSSSSSQLPPTPTKPDEKKRPSSLPPLPPLDAQAAPTGLAVTWLGTSSGAPTKSRNVSSVAVRAPRRAVLVDAGEGSAKQLAALGGSGPGAASSAVPLSNIGTILITHLHGDHCFGLPATLAAICSARAAAARAVRRRAVLGAEESGLPPPPYRQAPRVLVAGPPGIALVVAAPCLLRGGRGYDAPVLVAEFTTDPARARPPARVEGIDSGCEVRAATLPPDRTRAAEKALAAREARRRGGGGGGGSGGPPPRSSGDDDGDGGDSGDEGDDEYFGGRSSGNLSYNSATASFTTPPRRRSNQASVHAVDVLKGLTWTLPAGTGVFAAPAPAGAAGTAAARAVAAVKPDDETEEERRLREQKERRRQQRDADLLDPPITIVAAQLQHRVPCWGYALSVAEPEAARQQWESGEERGGAGDAIGDKTERADGAKVDDDSLLSSSSRSSNTTRKVVILGDTCDSSAMAAVARDADLLSHEATFSARMFDKAEIAQHSTAAMAGGFAAECGAKRLVLTHFSARYPDQKMERVGGGGSGGYGGGRFGGGGRGGGRGGRGGFSAPASASAAAAAADGSLAEDVPLQALEALVEEAKSEFRSRSSARGRSASASAGAGGASSSSSYAASAAPECIDVIAATDLLTVRLPRKVPVLGARGGDEAPRARAPLAATAAAGAAAAARRED